MFSFLEFYFKVWQMLCCIFFFSANWAYYISAMFWVVIFFTFQMCNLIFNISFMSSVLLFFIYSFICHFSFCIVLALVFSFQSSVSLTVCSCHVTYVFQSEFTVYSCLNVKELLAQSRCEIWILSDCNWTQTHNHIVHSQTKWLWVQVQLQLSVSLCCIFFFILIFTSHFHVNFFSFFQLDLCSVPVLYPFF